MSIHSTLLSTSNHTLFQKPTSQPLLEKNVKSKIPNFFQHAFNSIQAHLPLLNISKVFVKTSPSKGCTAFINALLAPCRTSRPEEVVGIDPHLYKKTLDNGLNFYVRKNTYPFPNKAYLRLVLRVGMLNETPAEKGIAHLIEHISQIETANFAKDEIMNYLNLKGVHWARDNNAHTGPEETVYKLDIPLDDPDTLEKSLLILSEVASKATLSEDIINNEKEIVIDELSQKRNAWTRYANEKRAFKCAGSPYATLVDTEGEIESVRNCPKEIVQNFYKRWYHPNNMAVIAVGDLDPKKTGDLIEKHFGKISPGSHPPSEHAYTLNVPGGKHFLCFTDPEITHSLVEIHHQLPPLTRGEWKDTLEEKDIHRGLVVIFFEELLKSRLNDLCEQEKSPFIQAGFSKSDTIPDWPSTNLYAVASEGQIPAAFRQLLLEIKRLKTHGFLQSEFDRVKKSMMADFAHQIMEKEKIRPGIFLRFYQAHFTKNVAVPDYEKFLEFKQKICAKLTLESINKKIPSLLPDDNQLISTVQPEKESLPCITEDILKHESEQAQLTETPPPKEENYDLPLLKQMPKAGKISKVGYHKNADITEYHLENGMNILFKPTTFENDTVYMHAFSLHGKRDADISKLVSAKFSEDFFDTCGIGDHDLRTLQKILSGRKVGFSCSIKDYTTTLDAACVPKDIETIFQLLNLTFTNPGYERAAFDKAIKDAEEDLRNLENDPAIIFAHTCNAINTQNHPYYAPLTFEDLKSIEYEACRDFHKQLHSNPADFTLTIVGNVQQSKIKQLAERYLAGLPKTSGKQAEFNYPPVTFPPGITRKDVIGDKNSNCMVALTFLTPPIYEFKERCLSTWCCKLLEQRLNTVLRFGMGKSYSQRCNFINPLIPDTNSETPAKAMVLLTCDPANKEILEKELMAQIRDLQVNGPTEIEIKDYRKNAAKTYSNILKTNAGWLQAINANAMWKREQDHFDKFEKELESFTTTSAKEQFSKLFSFENFSVVTLLPKVEISPLDSRKVV